MRTGVAALVLAAGFLVPVSGTAVAAPGCYGSSCYGKDPQAMGCTDAETLDTIGDGGGIVVELRHSYACKAAWVRYQNHHAMYGAVYIKSLSTEGMAARKDLGAYIGEEGWTGMLSFDENVIGCSAVYSNNRWYTTCTRAF
ncbi:MAG: hypothetical protein QOF58_254 [Pseudonocardiales bacterium]|nr:hypothetical protein [Pseudonocardiales bacterium]